MKRKLTRAYDRMTMPEICVQRIEQRLQQELEGQKTGIYSKTVSPVPAVKNSWFAAAAAVCLMIVLSVSGTMLFLRAAEHLRMDHQETVITLESIETTAPETPSDWYSVATGLSVDEVEAFAKTIRHNVLTENWKALADKISYPLIIQDQEIREKKNFVEWMEIFSFNPSFAAALDNETCTAMFCNWQGICMADGRIWFNEVNGELKITAVNAEIREEVLQNEQKKQVPMEFADVLSGYTMKFIGSSEEMLLEEYCAALWGDVNADGFAVVDMDGDGVCEVVISVQTADRTESGHLVLRMEGEGIRAYPFRRGELYDLKKDGSFGSAKGGPGQDSFRLRFEGDGRCQMMRTEVAEGVIEVMWHTYPCQRPELLLQSYEYVTGTGRSRLPGGPYYSFEGLVLGSMGNDWSLQKEYLIRQGMICVEDEGTLSVFDPDAPGTVFYGTLTNENGWLQLAELGFYICTEEKEYVAEVRELLTGEPEYVVDAHLPALGSMGRRVFTPEELVAYFGITQYSDAVISERHAAKAVVENFTIAWIARDEKAMKRYLADDFREDTRRNGTEYSPAGTPELMAIRDLPHRGEECYVTAEFRETEQNSCFSVCLDMVKQKDGWKVQSCYFGSE